MGLVAFRALREFRRDAKIEAIGFGFIDLRCMGPVMLLVVRAQWKPKPGGVFLLRAATDMAMFGRRGMGYCW